MLIKQRWYRGQGAQRIRDVLGPELGDRTGSLLQGFGGAGWNVVPVPMRMNSWLFRHKVASFVFNFGAYPAAGGVVYGSHELGQSIGESIEGQ